MSRSARSCSTVARRGSACRLKGWRLPAQAVVVRADYAPLCFLLLPERPAQGQTRPKTNFLVLAVDRRCGALCRPGGGRDIAAHRGVMSEFPGCALSTRCDVAGGDHDTESHVRITIRPLGGGRTGILSPRPPSGTGTIVRHKERSIGWCVWVVRQAKCGRPCLFRNCSPRRRPFVPSARSR